jgi:hypothetical protein
MSDTTSKIPLRRQVYVLLIIVAVALVCSRTLAVTQVFEPYLYHDQPTGKDDPETGLRAWPSQRPRPVPTFGSNDRSRWATIRALVDDGTYAIGYRIDPEPTGPNLKPGEKANDHGIITEDGWKSVDKVLHPKPDPNDPHKYYFYSSKPPLLPTLLAGEYWVLKHVFGLEIADPDKPDRTFIVMRIILLTVSAVPLATFLALLAGRLEQYGTTDWGRIFILTAACFGTFLTLFAVTLNNHVLAACFAFYALCVTLHIWREPNSGPLWFILAGLLAAFTAAIELPAAALLALVYAVLVWRNKQRTTYWFLPAVAVVVAAAITTNYLALDRWEPAYAEANPDSEDTGFWYKYKGSIWRKDAPDEEVPKRGPDFAKRQGETTEQYILHCLIGHHGIVSLTPLWLLSLAGMVYGATRFGRPRGAEESQQAASLPHETPTAPPPAPEPPPPPPPPPKEELPANPSPPAESPASTAASESVLASPPQESPFQFGSSTHLLGSEAEAPASLPEESPFQFSGFATTPSKSAPSAKPQPSAPPREPAAPAKAPVTAPTSSPTDKDWAVANEQPLIAWLTLILTVVVVGFYLWRTSNYSGVSNGLRWLFWLIPFWLLSMVPVVDYLARSRWGRILCYALLAVSIFSATYRDWNPWRHPWLWQVMQAQGWLPY